ncbi:MAG: type III-B CRISPR module RAMP protein Cmr1 [Campylobacteraceae bacterium]|jgi:CRISPR-associated protein Cmr1|nr:type III-B CRISPR module RAMP protein Cmr1 [Campylobacteraceae bacterium]
MNISRFINNEFIQCEAEFVTPAFLGGADQSAELRTASFKAALRWWWRVLYEAQHKDKIYEKESELFGSTDGASKVRIEIFGALSTQTPNFLRNNFNGEKIYIKTIKTKDGRDKRIEIDAIDYLAYGLYAYEKGDIDRKAGNVYNRDYFNVSLPFKINIYIEKENNKSKDEIIMCLKALFIFGGIGSRSRNGFGSLHLINNTLPNITTKIDFLQRKPQEYPTLNQASRLFETKEEFSNWEGALSKVAIAYKNARSKLEPKHKFEIRGLLSRPIEVKGEYIAETTRKRRSPKQFIMHIAKTPDNKYVGRILTLPIIFYEKDKKGDYNNMIDSMYKSLNESMNDKTSNILKLLGAAK